MILCLCLAFAACNEQATTTNQHDLTSVEYKAATCTENGNIAYWYCQECDKYYSDEKGENEVAEDALTINATGHDWNDNICVNCGYDAGGSKGLLYNFDEDSRTYTVSGKGTCTDKYVDIPAVYNGYSVVGIEENAFKNCTGITGIRIPQSVTVIGNGTATSYGAFNGCSGLKSMVLPFVGQNAGATAARQTTLFGFIFGGMGYTGGMRVKQNYSSTGNGTYYVPSGLTDITVLGGDIFYGAFYDCSQIVSITLGDDVTDIGMYAFYNCSKLERIVIGKGVTNIRNYAFGDCKSLAYVYYAGSEAEWNAIVIGGTSNNSLSSATIVYYSENRPDQSGSYWHYDQNGEVCLWTEE